MEIESPPALSRLPLSLAWQRSAKMNQVRKHVCLFGTSADPPTGRGGHLGIVTHLISLEEFDEVRILPVYRHMFENKRGKQAPFSSRIEMCRILFQNVSKVVVSEAERICFENAAKNIDENKKASIRVGTADLLAMLISNEPEVNFTLALGADTFIDLANGKWRRGDEVIQLVGHRMVVFRRQSDTNDRVEKEDQIQQCIAKWQILNETKSSIQLITVPSLNDTSSSIVRSTMNESVLSKYVTRPILEYIKQNKLYAFADTTD